MFWSKSCLWAVAVVLHDLYMEDLPQQQGDWILYVYNAFLREAVGFMILAASFPHYLNIKHAFLLSYWILNYSTVYH